jgi:hypothetical protein
MDNPEETEDSPMDERSMEKTMNGRLAWWCCA